MAGHDEWDTFSDACTEFEVLADVIIERVCDGNLCRLRRHGSTRVSPKAEGQRTLVPGALTVEAAIKGHLFTCGTERIRRYSMIHIINKDQKRK